MEQSLRFDILEARITELRVNLLPHEFSSIGEYSPQEQDMAKGFRLLSHAEFESYLEDVSKDIVMDAVKKWRNDRIPSITIVSFLAAYHSSWSSSNDIHNDEIISLAKNRTNPKDSIMDAVNIALKQFIQKIKSNHGIKAENFKTLIFPTGLDVDSIDNNLFIKLDSFGSKRGEIAHNSAKVVNAINPQDELNEVTELLDALRELDGNLIVL
ncbi:HEPN domain-containing protein [Serratia quinivorans]|uniref:HEPN domain-containing protein n=1 Tax=Serratia quinivorans TaxID=137545 RepID=UPI00217953A4|nr:HEPN domain-containing protein [Serratia quinivorans]CAI0827591.1 Uncharacterised protein [Serratia quinivorans]